MNNFCWNYPGCSQDLIYSSLFRWAVEFTWRNCKTPVSLRWVSHSSKYRWAWGDSPCLSNKSCCLTGQYRTVVVYIIWNTQVILHFSIFTDVQHLSTSFQTSRHTVCVGFVDRRLLYLTGLFCFLLTCFEFSSVGCHWHGKLTFTAKVVLRTKKKKS